MKKPFTTEEEEVMRLLISAHEKFIKLKISHPDDIIDFKNGVHSCQDTLIRRVAFRDYPDYFYQHKD